MNNFEKFEILHKEVVVKHPVDIAFDTFKKYKNGYCVILYRGNTLDEEYLIKSVKWIPIIPHSSIIGYMRKVIDMGYNIKVYRYLNELNYCIDRERIEDVTLKIKMATEHANIIWDLMSLN